MKPKIYKNYQIWLMAFTFLCQWTICDAQTITLNPGDNINTAIQGAPPGSTIILNPGDYGRLNISEVNGTPAQPIIIRGVQTDGSSRINGKYTNTWECRWGCPGDQKSGRIVNSSYLILENVHFTGGTEGLIILGSDHLVFNNCFVSDIANTGVKIRKFGDDDYSHHIDWFSGELWDIGQNQDGAYSEQFYIGQAQQAYDETHDIWIEGAQIHDNLGGESIDVKPESYNITVRNCNIYNNEIYAYKNPNDSGDPRNEINRGAIQITGGNETSGKNPPNDHSVRHSNIWIESNTISNIYNDDANNDPAADGIFIFNRPGVYVKDNIINDVETYGFRAFGTEANYTTLIDDDFASQVTNAGVGVLGISNDDPAGQNITFVADMGENPLSPQSWPITGIADDADDILYLTAPNSLIAGSTATVTVKYSTTESRDIHVSLQLDTAPFTEFATETVTVDAGFEQSVDVIITIPEDLPEAVDAYQLISYLTPTGVGWEQRFDDLPWQNIDAGGALSDEIISISAPTEVKPGKSVKIPINFSATTDRDIRVIFQKDHDTFEQFASKRVDVQAGDDQNIEVELNIPANTPVEEDAYQFQVYLTTDGGGWGDRFNNISERDVDCLPAIPDTVYSISAPTEVIPGQTVTIPIHYGAATDRDLRVVFQLDASPWTNYLVKTIDIQAGDNQSIDVEMTIPIATPIDNDAYQFQIAITTDGGGWGGRLHNMSLRDVDCLPAVETGSFYLKNGANERKVFPLGIRSDRPLILGSKYGRGYFFSFEISPVEGDPGRYYLQTFDNYVGSESCQGGVGTYLETQGTPGECAKWEIIPHGDLFKLRHVESGLYAGNDYCQNWPITRVSLTDGESLCSTWSLEPYEAERGRSNGRQAESLAEEEMSLLTEQISVYPNPATDHIVVSGIDEFSYKLMDTAGKMIKSGISTGRSVIDVSSLEQGVYFLEYDDGFFQTTKKIIVD